MVKNPPTNAGDKGSIPGLGRSPGGGNNKPSHYSCLEKPTEEPEGPQPMGLQGVKHNLATDHTHTHTHIYIS